MKFGLQWIINELKEWDAPVIVVEFPNPIPNKTEDTTLIACYICEKGFPLDELKKCPTCGELFCEECYPEVGVEGCYDCALYAEDYND